MERVRRPPPRFVPNQQYDHGHVAAQHQQLQDKYHHQYAPIGDPLSHHQHHQHHSYRSYGPGYDYSIGSSDATLSSFATSTCLSERERNSMRFPERQSSTGSDMFGAEEEEQAEQEEDSQEDEHTFHGVDAKVLATGRQFSQALVDEHHETRPQVIQKEPVATWKGLSIYELEPRRFDTVDKNQVKIADKRLQMKRYVAQFQVHATLDELTALLQPGAAEGQSQGASNLPSSTSKDRARQASSSVLSPEIIQSSSLWRPMRKQLASWTGIQWVVHEMPTLLTHERDYVLLERHHVFKTKTWQRGYVQLHHSTEAPHFDPGLAHGSRKLTRGVMHQSGVVALESETVPGLIHVSVAMEVDFFGSYSPLQHRHIVIKRVSKWADLRDLIWKSRMAQSGRLVLIASLKKVKALASGGGALPKAPGCDVCPLRPSTSGDSKSPSQASCQCCQRRMCPECSRKCDFPAFLVDEAMASAMARQHPSSSSTIAALSAAALKHAKDNGGSVSAMVCALCISEYAKPQSG